MAVAKKKDPFRLEMCPGAMDNSCIRNEKIFKLLLSNGGNACNWIAYLRLRLPGTSGVLIDLLLGTGATHPSHRRSCVAQYISESRI